MEENKSHLRILKANGEPAPDVTDKAKEHGDAEPTMVVVEASKGNPPPDTVMDAATIEKLKAEMDVCLADKHIRQFATAVTAGAMLSAWGEYNIRTHGDYSDPVRATLIHIIRASMLTPDGSPKVFKAAAMVKQLTQILPVVTHRVAQDTKREKQKRTAKETKRAPNEDPAGSTPGD